MIYFDTSYLVRLYYQDKGWAAVRDLAAGDHVACAWHGQAEMLAAFHRKLRESAIKPTHYTVLLEQFSEDNRQGAFHWLTPGPETRNRVTQVFADLPGTVYLRAADALHLAAAAENGFKVIHSNDTHLLAAAKHFGLAGRNVIAPSPG